MKLLHMYTSGDPLRNATFTFFGDPDYFLTDFPSDTCKTCIGPAFAWNHGDIQPEIANTWLGFVGPGINHLGETGKVWTDHTDVRPTMLSVLGLTDDYAHDGRSILPVLHRSAVPATLAAHRATLLRLEAAYKQLDAPFGQLGMDSLAVSTRGVSSGTADDDAEFTATQRQLASWLSQRDRLAGRMELLVEGAEFGKRPVNERQAKSLTAQADALIAEVHRSAG
jgi:hypothetical protein